MYLISCNGGLEFLDPSTDLFSLKIHLVVECVLFHYFSFFNDMLLASPLS